MTLPRETYVTHSCPRPRPDVLDPVICTNVSTPLVGTGHRTDNADARKQMACLTLQPLYPRGRSSSNHSLDYRCEWTIGALVLTEVSQSVRSQTVHPVPLEVIPCTVYQELQVSRSDVYNGMYLVLWGWMWWNRNFSNYPSCLLPSDQISPGHLLATRVLITMRLLFVLILLNNSSSTPRTADDKGILSRRPASPSPHTTVLEMRN